MPQRLGAMSPPPLKRMPLQIPAAEAGLPAGGSIIGMPPALKIAVQYCLLKKKSPSVLLPTVIPIIGYIFCPPFKIIGAVATILLTVLL